MSLISFGVHNPHIVSLMLLILISSVLVLRSSHSFGVLGPHIISYGVLVPYIIGIGVLDPRIASFGVFDPHIASLGVFDPHIVYFCVSF